MQYALLILALISTNAFAQRVVTTDEANDRYQKYKDCPINAVAVPILSAGTEYEAAKARGESEFCLSRYACDRDRGPYVLSQFERDRKGQLFLHRYSVQFRCAPNGIEKKTIKRLD